MNEAFMNIASETIGAIKGLRWGAAGRTLVREGKVVSRALAGVGVKGYYLPTALGAVAGGGIAYGNRSLDGAQGTRGTAASIWKGAARGAMLGLAGKAGMNLYRGGAMGAIGRVGSMAYGGAARVGRAAAFDAELAYRMGAAKASRYAGPAVDMAGRAYGAAQAGYGIGSDYAGAGFAAASTYARNKGAAGIRYGAGLIDKAASRMN
jgi:hypothetical protein